MTEKCPGYGPRGRLLALLVMVPLLLGFALAQWCMDRWSLGLAWDAYASAGHILANAAVGMTLFVLLAAVTRRLLLPLLLVAVGHALFYAASAIKLRLLGLPIILPDLHFLAALDADSVRLFGSYVDMSLPVAGCAGMVLALAVALFRWERRWCLPLAWSRLSAGVLAAILLVALWMAAWPWRGGWYGAAFVRPSPLSALPAALRGGLVSSLVYYHGQQRHRRLVVDAAALQEVLARLKAVGPAPAVVPRPARLPVDSPDVVVVLSESFMDPFVLNGMRDLPDPIPNMRAALKARHGGRMLAPTFGGGTVRTEFEVLTGMPVEAFQDAYYPYVDLNVDAMPGVHPRFHGHLREGRSRP